MAGRFCSAAAGATNYKISQTLRALTEAGTIIIGGLLFPTKAAKIRRFPWLEDITNIIHIHTYIHTYIHTCMHTYTYIHACIHTYIHRYIQTYIEVCITYFTYIGTGYIIDRYVYMYLCMC